MHPIDFGYTILHIRIYAFWYHENVMKFLFPKKWFYRLKFSTLAAMVSCAWRAKCVSENPTDRILFQTFWTGDYLRVFETSITKTSPVVKIKMFDPFNRVKVCRWQYGRGNSASETLPLVNSWYPVFTWEKLPLPSSPLSLYRPILLPTAVSVCHFRSLSKLSIAFRYAAKFAKKMYAKISNSWAK